MKLHVKFSKDHVCICGTYMSAGKKRILIFAIKIQQERDGFF